MPLKEIKCHFKTNKTHKSSEFVNKIVELIFSRRFCVGRSQVLAIFYAFVRLMRNCSNELECSFAKYRFLLVFNYEISRQRPCEFTLMLASKNPFQVILAIP